MRSDHNNSDIGTKQDTSSPLYLLLLKSVGGKMVLFSFASEVTDSCLPHMSVKEGLLKIPSIGYQKTR